MAYFSELVSSLVNKARRQVRSYVLRKGRITQSQQKHLQQYWSEYGIDFEKNELELHTVFDRIAPYILEIGCGRGETTVQMATQYPENNYLAVDVHKPGIGSLLRQLVRHNLSNVRILCHDVVDVLQYQLPHACLDKVYIFFPDPWPKKRHYKRRLINVNFLNLLKKKLKVNSCVFIATDWQDYAEQIIELLEADKKLFNLAGKNNFSPRPVWRSITKFEQRAIDSDRKIYDFSFSLSNEQ